MILLLPLILIIGLIIFVVLAGILTKNCDASDFIDAIFLAPTVLIGGAFFCLLYGAYTWMKYGIWESIDMIESLNYLTKITGVNFDYFLAESNWIGLQKINELYAHTNLGWTLFGVPLIAFFIILRIRE